MSDPGDLLTSAQVAELLHLGSRRAVTVYQRRYPDMPRPVVKPEPNRVHLWSRREMTAWARKVGRR